MYLIYKRRNTPNLLEVRWLSPSPARFKIQSSPEHGWYNYYIFWKLSFAYTPLIILLNFFGTMAGWYYGLVTGVGLNLKVNHWHHKLTALLTWEREFRITSLCWIPLWGTAHSGWWSPHLDQCHADGMHW